jgi:hypothetical protein
MKRRAFIQDTVGCSLAMLPLIKVLGNAGSTPAGNPFLIKGPAKPITIYNNWSSYDELSDNIKLTEELAMKEFAELLRLKSNGVQIDYYMMDAFWFDKAGGYRTWHKQHWPNGPGIWLDACRRNHIKPGLWFSTNLITMGGQPVLDVIPEWKDSVGTDPNIMCLFEGGYLRHLGETLQIWADKGVEAFKFDFAYFSAATKEAKERFSTAEIEEKNKLAFMNMLKAFRKNNPHVLITGYNGFGGDMENTYTPFKKTVDLRWLDVFDTLYSGDPRFSDVPMMNIWRSQDCYSDHMVRQFEYNGLPLSRIDNCAFMIGKTGTCYRRATQAWKGMLVLEFARGGCSNVFHGNLELLTDPDMRWFAKVQQLFQPLQQNGGWSSFGAVPGTAAVYGFKVKTNKGEVLTVVNPSQEIINTPLPANQFTVSRVLYTDGGFSPSVKNNRLHIGPEQLVVIGLGEYADNKYFLGKDDSIQIPQQIEPINAVFLSSGKNEIAATITPFSRKNIRILFQQYDASGFPYRTWGGAPPDGKTMDKYLQLTAEQDGKSIPLTIMYNKMIWSGLSWAAGEIPAKYLNINRPLQIRCSSAEKESLTLKARVYAVGY